MSTIFPDLQFGRHQRWLDRAMGAATALMVFDPEGAAVWGGECRGSQALGAALAGTQAAEGLQRLDLGGGGAALCRPLGRSTEERIGWLAIALEPGDACEAPIAPEAVAELLEDLSAGIVDEYRQKADLEMLTEELGARYEELHLVYAVDEHVKTHAGDNQSVFQSLLQATAGYLNVDVVAFVRPSKDICQYATELSADIHNLDLVLVEMRGDLYRFIQVSKEPLVINAPDDPRRAYIFTDMPYKVLACPVRAERKVDSLVVLLNHRHKPDFTNSDRKLAEILANQLSGLINTYLLLDEMKEFNQQMANTLIEAVEAKDPYTRGHSERVNFLSMEIGRAMGLSPDELSDLHWASLLHDVGKIGIPDAVLCKPTRLTQDEFKFIMVHPERSYEILRHIKHLEKAVVGARHHQEMYDGKGYPSGLKGERIPLHGRIIAVPDTYDSITSSRAYRAGRSHEVAMQEIDRVAGSQLDPAIVEVFKGLVAQEPEWLQRFNIKRDKA